MQLVLGPVVRCHHGDVHHNDRLAGGCHLRTVGAKAKRAQKSRDEG